MRGARRRASESACPRTGGRSASEGHGPSLTRHTHEGLDGADSDAVSVRHTASPLPLLLPLLSLVVGGSLAAQGAARAGKEHQPSDETRHAVEQVLDANALPANRVQLLKQLERRAAEVPDDRPLVRDAATRVMDSALIELRAAAAQALGSTGSDAVPALTRAMGDYHYQVRVAAATSLGRIGRPSFPAAAALAGALDPYLGAATEAATALLAIGPEALPIVETRFKALAPGDHARPVITAVMASLHNKRDLVTEALSKDFTRGPNGAGFVLIEPLRTSASGTPYQPAKHRIRARFTVLHYGSPRKVPPDMQETGVEAWQSVNTGLFSLAGRRAGDRVRLLMSPDIAESLVLGTSKHQMVSRTHVSGTTGYFDVTIDRVCEPQIWELSKGGGIFGPIKFETSCRD
jgi:hypothetical protein